MSNGAATVEISLLVPLQMLNIQLTFVLAILFLGIYPREQKQMFKRQFVHKCLQQHYSIS